MWGAGVKEHHCLEPVTTYDVTPTLLWMNNLAVSEMMNGTVIEDALLAKSLEIRPVTHIATFGPRQEKKVEEALTDSIDDQIKSKLRALGYIN